MCVCVRTYIHPLLPPPFFILLLVSSGVSAKEELEELITVTGRWWEEAARVWLGAAGTLRFILWCSRRSAHG